MQNCIRRFKWFWAWQDEKEEDWLRAMSQQGWHLVSAKPFGVYYFRGGDKSDFVYRLDYQTNKKDRDNYLQIFHDAGWEYVGEMSGWQYFRKRVDAGESPEIYTDPASKAIKYKRVLTYLGFIEIFMVVILSSRILQHFPYPWWGAIQIFFVLVVAILTYALIRLAVRIRQLKNVSK